MKTLFEILDEVKSGGKPDYEDLRYAVVALDALRHFDNNALNNLRKAKLEGKPVVMLYDPDWQARESFERFKKALGLPPKEYCGITHDPDNPEYQRFRKAALSIYAAVEKKLEMEGAKP